MSDDNVAVEKPVLFYRAAELRAADLADNGEIRLICSTDAAVDMGGYREVLVHTREAVNVSSARSLLLNHDRDQIIGGVRNIEIRDGQMHATVFIAESAKTASGTSIRELVKTGALHGVSIGYGYDRAGARYDEASNTVTADNWMLREITLTPTQADTRAHVVRSLPDYFVNTRSDVNTTAAIPAAIKKGAAPMADENKPSEGDALNAAVETSKREVEALKGRAAELKKITEVAESQGLRGSKYLDMPYAKALEAMLADKAEQSKTEIKAERSVVVEVGKSQVEKADEEAVAALVDGKALGLQVAARHARAHGADTSEWDRGDIANYFLGTRKGLGGKRSANVTSSNFSTVVLANYMDKAVMQGFSAGETTYQLWTNRRVVSDFKTFAAGALDSANLVSTAENQAFPELTKAEHSFTGSLGLYGATISLTYQALVNDDLGEFSRMLNRAGAVAARTIDKLVITALEALTWTGNTTTAIPLGTAGNLDVARAAFANKTGGAGEKLGNTPKFLLVPPCLRRAALGETTALYNGTTSNGSNADLVPVICPHLAQAATASLSKYYLIANPAMVDTVTAAFLQGAEGPQVMEYDAGAVAKRSWKITQAFAAVGATTTISGTVYIPGMYQGDGAV